MAKKQVMYVNGKLLAEYLKKYGVSKIDFLNALTSDDPFYARDDEGCLDICDAKLCELGLELYDGIVPLNEEVADRFVRIVGYDNAVQIIEWRMQEFDECFREKTRNLISSANYYANKSKAVQTSVGCF